MVGAEISDKTKTAMISGEKQQSNDKKAAKKYFLVYRISMLFPVLKKAQK